jgi:hypothetical protein
MSYMVQLKCPFCAAIEDDDFECLDVQTIDKRRCDTCNKPYHYLIYECRHCAHETVVTWAQPVSPTTLGLVTCESCGRVNDNGDEFQRDYSHSRTEH